jgi:hypothetical protein
MFTKAQYSNIVPELWSKDFYDELRPELGIAALVQNKFQGVISKWGDTVKVQQFQTPGRAEVLRNDNEAYSTQVPIVTNTDLVVDRRAVYPVDVTDWAEYQANEKYQEEIRKIIVHEIARAVDQEILDTIAPATTNSGNANMTKALFALAQKQLNKLNVPKVGRIALIDEEYLEDLIQVDEILSHEYSPSSQVLMTGSINAPVYGFKIYVSNLLGSNEAYFFHPSFMQVAVQQGASYKEMDMESKTNVPSMRVRGMNLFGLKQFDDSRVYKITA